MIRRSARLSLVAVLVTAALVALLGTAGASPSTALAGGSATEPSPVTATGDEDASECISALPRPGCDRRDTDAMQIAVLLVMTAGVGLIGWRIGRAVRARDRSNTPPSTSA